MCASRNDITGDEIKSGLNSDAYKDSWERIFVKKNIDEPAYVSKAREDVENYTDTPSTDDHGLQDYQK